MERSSRSSAPSRAELDDDALAEVSTVVTEFEAPAGHVLTQPGREVSGMFVLQEGTVRVELTRSESVTLGPREFFGEPRVLARRIASLEMPG